MFGADPQGLDAGAGLRLAFLAVVTGDHRWMDDPSDENWWKQYEKPWFHEINWIKEEELEFFKRSENQEGSIGGFMNI